MSHHTHTKDTPTRTLRRRATARARELRAQGLMLKDIARQLQSEGFPTYSVNTLSRYCTGTQCPIDHRGKHREPTEHKTNTQQQETRTPTISEALQILHTATKAEIKRLLCIYRSR